MFLKISSNLQDPAAFANADQCLVEMIYTNKAKVTHIWQLSMHKAHLTVNETVKEKLRGLEKNLREDANRKEERTRSVGSSLTMPADIGARENSRFQEDQQSFCLCTDQTWMGGGTIVSSTALIHNAVRNNSTCLFFLSLTYEMLQWVLTYPESSCLQCPGAGRLHMHSVLTVIIWPPEIFSIIDRIFMSCVLLMSFSLNQYYNIYHLWV